MCRVPLLVTFDLELWPQGQISDFTIANCVNFSHFHLILWNHFMDWYYLIHKYNTKSSRAKLGNTGKNQLLILNFILFKWINYFQKCFITEVNISLSLQIFYHKLFMAGPTEMDFISMISSFSNYIGDFLSLYFYVILC